MSTSILVEVNKPTITIDAMGLITIGEGNFAPLSHNHDGRYYLQTQIRESLPNIGFDIAGNVIVDTGQMAWNATERTVDIGLNGVTLQLGQEQVVNVRNATAELIPNGTVCMAAGTVGNSGRVLVAPMDGRYSNNAMYLLGIATEDIPANTELTFDGFVTTFGKIRHINTSMWSEGDVLYTSTTEIGKLTNIPPTTGLKQPIAIVISNAINGTLFVRIETLNYNAFQTKGTLDMGVAPESVTSSGVTGEVRITPTFMYICIATNSWVRTPLSTWS